MINVPLPSLSEPVNHQLLELQTIFILMWLVVMTGNTEFGGVGPEEIQAVEERSISRSDSDNIQWGRGCDLCHFTTQPGGCVISNPHPSCAPSTLPCFPHH
jgi:hypothetical protein